MKRTFTLSLVLCMMLFAFSSKAGVVYTEMNLTADQTNTWLWFAWGPDTDGIGLWVNPGASLRVETYGDNVIGYDDNGLTFLSAVDYESEIGAGSAWQTPTTASYLNDADHAQLNGTTFYAGFQLRDASEQIYYGWMQIQVAADGLSFTLIDMAYEDVAGTSILAGVVSRQLIYDNAMFIENLASNDGHIMNQLNVSLLGANFSVATGNMTEGTHFTTENVPEGLAVEIIASDAVTASIALTGQATNNVVADTVNNMTINFTDAAFDGIAAGEIDNSNKADIFVKFFGEYEIIYEDLPDMVCESGGWVPFESAYFENFFGIWHDGTDFRLETYGKDVIGVITGANSFVTPLDLDVTINAESDWVASGAWPNESYLTMMTYDNWYGVEKYAGLKLILGDAVMYGWVRLGVSEDGSTITVYDWAFNTKPDEDIRTGQLDNTGISTSSVKSLKAYPNPCENHLLISTGEMSGNVSMTLMDILGNVYLSKDLNVNPSGQVEIDMSSMPSGFYIVNMKCGTGTYISRIIKE